MVENVIQIKSGITINVDKSIKWGWTLCMWKTLYLKSWYI